MVSPRQPGTASRGTTRSTSPRGRDPRWDRESVGLVLMGAMIRRAIERGYRRFDFLRGEDPYKRHWTATERVTEEITIVRRGWRGRWLRALDAAADMRARLGGGA